MSEKDGKCKCRIMGMKRVTKDKQKCLKVKKIFCHTYDYK
jgi:hypothetical protein